MSNKIIQINLKKQKTRVAKQLAERKTDEILNEIDTLIQNELEKLATKLEIHPGLLKEWLSKYGIADQRVVLALLRLGIRYHLSPLHHEIALATYENGAWQAIVTMDGLYKLINQEPTFTGITFIESDEKKDGIPIWMECVIYRSDRTAPVIIKEYFEEVKNSLDSWGRMPRRMLRHRTLQQCARVAFGFSGLATYFEGNDGPKLTSQVNPLDHDLKPKIRLTRSEELKYRLEGSETSKLKTSNLSHG